MIIVWGAEISIWDGTVWSKIRQLLIAQSNHCSLRPHQLSGSLGLFLVT